MREQIINTILNEKIIVIVRGVEKEKLIPLAEALYKGGIRLLEITYRPDGAVSDEETAGNIRLLAQHFAGRMFIGAGTVLTERQAERTKEAGGTFVISPDACPEVIRRSRALGLVSIPGALTPTEAMRAQRSGADFVKLFPVTDLGPGYVRAIRAPLSHIRFLAVGGMDLTNIGEYMRAGALGIGVGGSLVDKKLLAAGDWDGITALAEKYVAAVKESV